MYGRVLSIVAAAILVCATLVIAEGQQGEIEAQRGMPTVTLISHQAPNLEHFADEMGAYPGTNLEVEMLPFSKYVNKVRIVLSGESSGYDIIWGDHQLIREFARNGWLQPIDDLVEANWSKYDFADYPESAWDALSYEDHIYAIPSSANIWLLYTRQDLFREAGLPYPPKILEDVLTAAKKLHEPATRYGIETTLKKGINGANAIDYFLRIYGGSWVDENLEPNFGGAAGRKATETLRELVRYAPPGILTHNNNDAMVAIQQDNAAMAYLWASRAGAVNDPDSSKVAGKITFHLPPPLRETTKHEPLSFVTGYGISKFSEKDADSIFNTIAYGTRRESQQEGADILLPTRLPVVNDEALQDKIPFFPPVAEAYRTGVSPAPMIPQASEFYTIVTGYFQEAIAGNVPIDKALANALEEAASFLESRR
jgi:ABC-type glycerol-3-phosphate transport system substrate-binding protein